MPAHRISVDRLLRLMCLASVVALIPSQTGLCAQERDKQLAEAPSTTEASRFAPGVLTVIPPAPEPEETFDAPQTLQALLDAHPEIQFGGDTHPEGQPHFDPRSRTLAAMARQVILRREIYCFEFSFKPLRHMLINVPQSNGRTQRKLIWYMVYRVRYRGGDLRPASGEIAGSQIYNRVESIHYGSRYFFPLLKLRDNETGEQYTDRILPAVTEKIKVREQITTDLYNSVEITRVKVPYAADDAAPGIWGVATWEDVAPDLDFISVDVFGLTNAFEADPENPNGPLRRKALQLNFYRPGDNVDQQADRIRFGVPAYQNEAEQAYILKKYGLTERLDYRWLFL